MEGTEVVRGHTGGQLVPLDGVDKEAEETGGTKGVRGDSGG